MAELATRNREEALDLLQESMLSLVTSYSDRPEVEWRPLFYRILQNRIRDWHRRQRIRRSWRAFLPGSGNAETEDNGPDSLDRLPGPGKHNPAERALKAELARSVKRVLADLPLRQQQAFLLRAWENLSVQETARAMGCSEGSVKTHYARAVRTLRQQLDEGKA